MRFNTAWLGLAAGVYVAAVLALFPAGTAYRWFAPPELNLAGIQGSVWRGRAALASITGFGVYDLEWSISPWSLLTGRLRAQVQARQPDGFVNAEISAGLGSTQIFDMQATTSLATIGQVVPVGDVQGLISAQFAELELAQGWPVRAIGQIRIADLQTPLLMPSGPSDLIPLGNYVVQLIDSGTPDLRGTFEDQGGPVEVEGSFTLSNDRTYELSGLVAARPDAPQEIVQAMAFLAPADSTGRRPFELTGRL
ncbi:MAG: type II secretion system protein N [Gammaproteobacteria bacterium]|nr:type II secretion system protein N [Gammaproteobacteria bacterium]